MHGFGGEGSEEVLHRRLEMWLNNRVEGVVNGEDGATMVTYGSRNGEKGHQSNRRACFPCQDWRPNTATRTTSEILRG